MKKLALFAIGAAVLASPVAAATLIDNGTSARYNDQIGTFLDGTNSFGGNFMFPLANVSGGDPALDIPAANEPNLSAASTALGSWLSNPASPGGSWSAGAVSIPSSWAVNTETAIIYDLDGGAGGLSNVNLSIGVDNGVFVWLNGTFLGGHLRPGGVNAGEFTLSLGNLGAGMNYLQVLREDHGVVGGYTIEVTGDANPAPVPLPAAAPLLIGAGAVLGFVGRRKRRKNA